MWKAQGAEAGAIASNLIVSCDRNGTKPCAARPLRARKRRRRSTRAPADAEVRALARFRSRDAQPLRACGLRFLAISSYGILFWQHVHSGSDDASHGRMAPSRSGLRPAGSGDRMDRVNCPVPRSAPRRPRRSASDPGMNTAVPHDMGKAHPIASPRSEEPVQNRRAIPPKGPDAGSRWADLQNNLLWQEWVAGTERQERFIFSQFEGRAPI